MNINKTVLAVLFASCLLSACDDKKPIATDGTQNSASGIKDASAATTGLNNANGMAMQGMPNVDASGNLTEFNDPNSPQVKIIYFTLDSSDIQPDFVPVVHAHAQYLVANPSLHVLLEGNTDERGSREYNIALGEQRARTVANMLMAQGVSETQIQIVSYGEEKPAATGSDESSWEQNRRVEIVYQR
ncbi:Peptidoglycan-associated lipoprotein [uncultured bacterium]|nr:Peptidoglycan-associated lipoprotein [uncultured bacterium]